MTEQLFRATDEDGAEVFGFIERLSFHYLRKSNRNGWKRYRGEVSDFPDLRPVKVVDMDAVVIEEEEALTTDKPNPPRPEPRPEYLRY